MNLSKTIKELKNSKKIDSNLIISTIQSFRQEILKDKSTKITYLYHKLHTIKKRIINNSSNVLLKNLIYYCFVNLDKTNVSKLKSSFLLNSNKTIIMLKENQEIINNYTFKKIKKRSTIHVQGYSKLIINILKSAKKQNKTFEVHTCILNPEKNGLKLIKELKKIKIKTKIYSDTSLLFSLLNSDLVLISCEQINKKGVISSIGSGIISEIAKKHNILVYICTNSMKFSKNKFELHKKTDKNKIINYEFELIDSENITGIISEIGIFTHKMFLHELKYKYKFLF